MPFIEQAYLIDETEPIQRLLITCADDSNIEPISFELAKFFQKQGQSVLWIAGNLGEKTDTTLPENIDLNRVLSGQVPATQVLQEKEGVFVLTGKADCFLAELSEEMQYQFLQNLKNLYPNFDKVVFAVDGKNLSLQKKWMNEAQEVYFVFHSKNLFLNRTSAWLKENAHLVKGLIGLGKNDQEVLLAYQRLKEILEEVPELILDIKKIAP